MKSSILIIKGLFLYIFSILISSYLLHHQSSYSSPLARLYSVFRFLWIFLHQINHEIVCYLGSFTHTQSIVLISDALDLESGQTKTSFSLYMISNEFLKFSFLLMLISFVVHVQIFVHGACSSVNYLYKETGLIVIIPWMIFIIINFVSF